MVPPLLYMVVVAQLYAEGGGATSGFGTLLMLPILWLALYGTQAQMIASIVATGVVGARPAARCSARSANSGRSSYDAASLILLIVRP